jgi:hypothetical protein
MGGMVSRMEKFRYKEALAAIRAGEPRELTPGQFLRYALSQQNEELTEEFRKQNPDKQINARWLSNRCGYRSNRIQTHFSQGGTLSADLCLKLAHMTDLPVAFWNRPRFDSDEAGFVYFDTGRDASAIHTPEIAHRLAPRQVSLALTPGPIIKGEGYTRLVEQPSLPMDERFYETPQRQLSARHKAAQYRAREKNQRSL